MIYDQVSALRGRSHEGRSWFGSPRQPKNKQESEKEVTEDERNGNCHELEVEIIKIRRQVERIKAIDAKKDEADDGASNLASKMQERAKNVTDECQRFMEETSILKKRNLETDLLIQKYVQERINNMAETKNIKKEDRKLKEDNLQKIAEMEQMEFFHKEMRALLTQFCMNEMNLEMEIEKDKVRYLQLEAEHNERMIITEQTERDIELLKKKVKRFELHRNAAKESAKSISMMNDNLHQDLDILKSKDCSQITRDEIRQRWAESQDDQEKNSTKVVHPQEKMGYYSERQLSIIHDIAHDNDSIANQTT